MNEQFLKASEPGCSLKTSFSNFFKNYATFSGRSSRSEYWYWNIAFCLITVLAFVAFEIIYNESKTFDFDTEFDSYGNMHITNWQDIYIEPGHTISIVIGWLLVVWLLVTFLPSLALTIRRLHDSDHNGWWVLIGLLPIVGSFALLVFSLLPTDPYVNRYGAVKGHDYPIKPTVNFSQPAPMSAPGQSPSSVVDNAAELEKYGKLLQQGLLSQEEFNEIKKRLLNL